MHTNIRIRRESAREWLVFSGPDNAPRLHANEPTQKRARLAVLRIAASNPEVVAAIGDRFVSQLRAMLKPKEFALMVARNHWEKSPLVCHSHDFTDANMVMAAAVSHVVPGAKFNNETMDDFTALMTAAWESAKPALCGKVGMSEAERGTIIEFPDFAPYDLPDLSPLVATAWHNDMCPSFTYEGPNFVVKLWADFPDPADREHEGVRFTLQYSPDEDNGGEYLRELMHEDSLDELRAQCVAAIGVSGRDLSIGQSFVRMGELIAATCDVPEYDQRKARKVLEPLRTLALEALEKAQGSPRDDDDRGMFDHARTDCEITGDDLAAWVDDLEARVGLDVGEFRTAVLAYRFALDRDTPCVFFVTKRESYGDYVESYDFRARMPGIRHWSKNDPKLAAFRQSLIDSDVAVFDADMIARTLTG